MQMILKCNANFLICVLEYIELSKVQIYINKLAVSCFKF